MRRENFPSIFSVLFFFSLFWSCLGTGEKRRQRAVEIQWKIVALLEEVSTVQDLQQRQKQLSGLFEELVDHIIFLDKWKKRHPLKGKAVNKEKECPCLEEAIHRVCCIEGASEILEGIQREALYMLNRYAMRSSSKSEGIL